ncbi:ABC transporter substrate-binding protein [Nitrospina watsonii]|uniref:Oligopeptide ABC transporter, oligopeptide-binding protein AppA n=1 Tax=Nitrospina watsonii TaxID=1323948 RepID=A0ABM9HEH3_9BACT|nr:ABC transporter substrate-binding protein [Nitrospina watsonii]CAI2718561.1 Putative oligopeptide ABC transporter, oligopeptide-binding protein AppA [Nitrospina watsonii]
MWTKRILIFLPLLVTLLLLQSFFWVPTYDRQGAGNPDRLRQFIETSIGDAQILNPILSADTASSRINELVFDGLIDYDDQLNLRGRLATDWILFEDAYLQTLPDFRAGGRVLKTPDDWIRYIRERLSNQKEWWSNVQSITVQPAEQIDAAVKLPERDADGKPVLQNGFPKQIDVAYRLQRPARLHFKLKNVDQHFFDPLEKLFGDALFAHFPHARFIRADDPAEKERLAEQYADILPVVEHNPVIRFDLRKGVRFHDGHEFDSGDVLFTYQSIMNPLNASPRTSDYEPVKRAEVLGPHQIQFVYKRLFSPAITSWMMGILPEHLLNQKTLRQEAAAAGKPVKPGKEVSMRDSDFNRHPIGTGPFVFQKWEGDVEIRLTRNEQYWEGPPEYHEFIMRIIPDMITQEMEFYAGAADNYGVQPHQVARLKDDPNFHSISTVGNNYSYIGYNLRKPLFADPRVRTALGMAIDVDKIIKHVMYNQAERVTGPFSKSTQWYDESVEPIPHDPEGALKILNDLGWKKNADGWLEKDGKVFEFNLITNHGNPIRKNIMTIVQNNWRKLGIKCNTQLFEWAVFLKDFVNAQKFDALILGWAMGFDPDLFQLWHSSQAHPKQLNFVGYKNPEADRLIVAIRREYDQDVQQRMTHQLHRLIAADQPYTFLFAGKSTLLLDKKIVIVEDKPDGSEEYKKIYPVKGGNIFYRFNDWRKLPTAPQFAR